MLRSRRLRVQLGILAAIAIGAALVVPVVLSGGSGPETAARCNQQLRFDRRLYVQRSLGSDTPTQKLAIGVGVLQGCGQAPANVDVRSLLGVPSSRAVSIDGATDVYVGRGVCTSATDARLFDCITRP